MQKSQEKKSCLKLQVTLLIHQKKNLLNLLKRLNGLTQTLSRQKCETIKESYFGKKEEVKDKLDDVAVMMSLTKIYRSLCALHCRYKTKLKILKYLSNTEKGKNKMYLSETHEKNACVEHPDLPEIKDSTDSKLHQLSWKPRKRRKEDQPFLNELRLQTQLVHLLLIKSNPNFISKKNA